MIGRKQDTRRKTWSITRRRQIETDEEETQVKQWKQQTQHKKTSNTKKSRSTANKGKHTEQESRKDEEP